MKQRSKLGAVVAVAMIAQAAGLESASMHGRWEVTCRDKDGNIKWVDYIDNLVVDVGLNEILDKFFKGSAYTAAHYVGLLGGTGTVAAGDTMSSHAGWTESTVYSNATRPTFTPGTVAAKSVDNSASKAVFNINAGGTIKGAFLATSSTKGGTAGVLVSAGLFTGGDKVVANLDTLNVQITYTGSSS